MSYRNPQIIIDRSAEIWADNISKIGQGVANTIQAYGQAKAKSAAAAKKSDEGYSVLTAQSAEKQRRLIAQAGKNFKGSDKQFEEWQEKARVYGEEILPLQRDNVLNTNLTNEQRADNRKKIGDFEVWLDSSVKSIGGVVDKTSYITDNKITSANYGTKYLASGNTPMERFNNYAAGFGLTNQEVEGMTLESYNAGDRDNEILGVKYSITPKQYKNFVDNKMLDEGSLGEPDDTGSYNGKWERDLKKWGSSDQQLFREIFEEDDINEALKIAGFIDKDTGKFTNKHLSPDMRLEVINGVEYTRQHIYPDGIFEDETYKGVKMSQAKALLALGDEESFYSLAKLGWGDEVTIDKWNSMKRDVKEDFLYQLMFEQDMSRVMKLPNGQLPETRVATEDDVAYYKKMGWDDITAGVGKKGDDNYERGDNVWFRTHGIKKIDKVGTVTSPNPPTDPKIGGRTLGDAKTILNNITNLGKDGEVAGLSEYTFSFKGSNDASMRQYRITPTADPNYVMVEQASSNGSFTDSNPVKTSMADIRKEFSQEESGEKGKGRFDKK